MTEKKDYNISIHEKSYNPEYDEGDPLGTLNVNLLLTKIEDNIYCVEEAVGDMTTFGVGTMPFRYKDIIEVTELDDGQLHFLEVLKKSNYVSFSYKLETNINIYESGKEFLNRVISHGGEWEIIGGLLTITLPPDSDLNTDVEVPVTVELCLKEESSVELTAPNIEEAINLILDHLKKYFEALQTEDDFISSKNLSFEFLSKSKDSLFEINLRPKCKFGSGLSSYGIYPDKSFGTQRIIPQFGILRQRGLEVTKTSPLPRSFLDKILNREQKYTVTEVGTNTKDFQFGQIEVAEILSKIMKVLDTWAPGYPNTFSNPNIKSVYLEGLQTKTLKVNDINVYINKYINKKKEMLVAKNNRLETIRLDCHDCGTVGTISYSNLADEYSAFMPINLANLNQILDDLNCSKCESEFYSLSDKNGELIFDMKQNINCGNCGLPIPFPRITMVPSTTQCIDCKDEQESNKVVFPPVPAGMGGGCPKCKKYSNTGIVVVYQNSKERTFFLGCSKFPSCRWSSDKYFNVLNA